MPIEIVSDEAALATRACEIICDVAARKPDAIIGLPTGATPVPLYFDLTRSSDAGTCDLRRVTMFAIDEFLGASRTTPGTNSAFFKQHLRVPVKALHVPNPSADDPGEHIAAYAGAVRRLGGMDLCVLGVGINGHVAFNEPGSERDSRARIVELTEETRRAHAATFGSLDAVPRRGLTLGIADLMEARALVVLASGAHKSSVVAQAIEGKSSAEVPATWLRDHTDVTWLLDEAAAAELQEARPPA
jgi:glucosamine-6-phosphate deaminase